VLDLAEDGLVLTEIAPGADLERDVLTRIPFEITVAPGLRVMDPAAFTEFPGSPALEPALMNAHIDRSSEARTA
jgi:propionate CoA-transferase